LKIPLKRGKIEMEKRWAPHLKKIGYCQKNNKIDLFQVRGGDNLRM